MEEQEIKNCTVVPSTSTKRLRRCNATDVSAAVAPVLPDDVVAEILAWLPVKSVLRCKSVCKGWLAMLSHPSFVRRHVDCSKKNPSAVILPVQDLCKSKSVSKMFYRYRPGDKVAELFFEHAITDSREYSELPSHCDGLLVVCTNSSGIYVCNPATRELMTLPPCRPCRDEKEGSSMPHVSLCRDTRSGAYKVFHAWYRWRDWSTGAYSVSVEVLTLGAENPCWRELPGCPHCPIAPGCTASVDGALYWLIDDDVSTPSFIMCLDASTEKFTRVPLPPSGRENTEEYLIAFKLKEIQGKLCFFHAYSRNKSQIAATTEIWFMSSNPASPAWTRYCSFNTHHMLWLYAPVLVWRGSEILLHTYKNFYSYDRRSNALKEVMNMRSDLLYVDPKTGKSDDGIIRDTRVFHVSDYTESLVAITPKRTH